MRFGDTLIYAKYLSVYVFFYSLFYFDLGGVVHIFVARAPFSLSMNI